MIRLLLAGLLLLASSQGLARTPAQELPPSETLGELFERVQTEALFADSKTFADALPRQPPDEILARYRAAPPAQRDALEAFVQRHFVLPEPVQVAPAEAPRQRGLQQHIAALWPQLLRPPVPRQPGSSALAFGHAHVVPGGRFREIYYWDSYFTLLGLSLDGHAGTVAQMVDGFADLIARYGHVPNGTRSYYLSRSQPPFFYLMVGLLQPQDPAAAHVRYLHALRAEHAFWMSGAEGLKPGTAAEHVVRLADGSLLNRYWDRSDRPRDESYREDLLLAQQSGRAPAELYREIRAAAESGWDFSSRWFADGRGLQTIETTSIVPVDLNSLLYGLEQAIAGACARLQDQACASDYGQRAGARRVAMDRLLWDAQGGRYLDYQWRRGERTRRLSAATLYPLFVGAATAGQAAAVASTVKQQLLAAGGLATTTVATGQQWDRPNGWAPLQWIAVSGLGAYGHAQLADEIADRWLHTVQRSFDAKGKLVEKYDVETGAPGGGGEYPLQDGFGWTNGVTRALIERQALKLRTPSGDHAAQSPVASHEN